MQGGLLAEPQNRRLGLGYVRRCHRREPQHARVLTKVGTYLFLVQEPKEAVQEPRLLGLKSLSSPLVISTLWFQVAIPAQAKCPQSTQQEGIDGHPLSH